MLEIVLKYEQICTIYCVALPYIPNHSNRKEGCRKIHHVICCMFWPLPCTDLNLFHIVRDVYIVTVHHLIYLWKNETCWTIICTSFVICLYSSTCLVHLLIYIYIVVSSLIFYVIWIIKLFGNPYSNALNCFISFDQYNCDEITPSTTLSLLLLNHSEVHIWLWTIWWNRCDPGPILY